jgi:hypothetical protein
MEGES